MEVKILRGLTSEIFKNINNPRVNFLIRIITPKSNAPVKTNNILVKKHNSTTYGD